MLLTISTLKYQTVLGHKTSRSSFLVCLSLNQRLLRCVCVCYIVCCVFWFHVEQMLGCFFFVVVFFKYRAFLLIFPKKQHKMRR